MKIIKKEWLILFLILASHLFFRFSQLGSKSPFTWDQVDFAWKAKDIIVDHRWPMLGPQAKLNSGIYVGPAYYYLAALTYFFTKLDPIASGVLAGVTSILTFLVIYLLTKKLFSVPVALLAVFIHTFSFYIINFDRIQWSVNLIAPISLIIFYALNQVINGQPKYFFLLATALGFSFHLHFTSVFFPLIVFLALPLLPKNKQTLKYGLVSIPLFLIWLLPNFLAANTQNATIYLGTYYHGLHLRRVLQVAGDAFIEFEGILLGSLKGLLIAKPIKYFLLPLFALIYYFFRPSRKRFNFCYLAGLWFLVPWLVFSVYSGEISSYYFSLTRPLVLIALAYLTWRLFCLKGWWLKASLIGFWLFYCFANVQSFLNLKYEGLDFQRVKVKEVIRKGEVIEFKEGHPESYLYYFYTRK
ncbi:hypothetical protein COT66_00425 [Candidatus Shapirobacteria bacterium CG09_land_8_20_14_0_10_49_15]|uniref:Glycosyltransferase RgtA/B/C/D-like domain-containing protein n=2 Tax=Candidatus Shapironibacteriota TaxID=1752721 RepID=A0A2M8L753_9BACT|nr:MAG: hypothetical protein COT66_00425 [Candidatus Shapirobacteria bacterium CG09_land_8_20_14_0_10_49_15]PJE70018.1 MAG: hypothetical protein COU97_02010 [Candidatus Shapirobacteria bacterium CG10_big_fil_rev_8_21_14_0_10_48_15]